MSNSGSDNNAMSKPELSQDERSSSEHSHSYSSSSEFDDLINDPTISHKIQANPSTPKATRATKKCLLAAKADPTAIGHNIATTSSDVTPTPTPKGGATASSDVTLEGDSTSGKMEGILLKLANNIESMTVQNMRNNNAFVGELPYFSIPKEETQRKL